MFERTWPVRRPVVESVSAPVRLLDADIVEIRVSLTPLKYWDKPTDPPSRELRPVGDTCYAQASVDRYLRIEAKDSRAISYLIRELLVLMMREYLGVNL